MADVKADWNDGFLFLANDLALDFLNTRPVIDGEAVELLSDFPALLRWFRAANLLTEAEASRLLRGPAAARARVLGDLLTFRERLRAEIVGWEKSGKVTPGMIEELNAGLSAHPMRSRIMPTKGPLEIEEYFAVREPEGLAAPISASAARLFANADHTRVRQCGACVLHFHDTSKKGTRRWCSMEICGNRAKVAAYAARQRQK